MMEALVRSIIKMLITKCYKGKYGDLINSKDKTMTKAIRLI
jgi:hypothetical protein